MRCSFPDRAPSCPPRTAAYLGSARLSSSHGASRRSYHKRATDRLPPDQFDKPISVTLDDNWVASEVNPASVILEYTERVARYTRGVLISSAIPVAAETLDEWAAAQDLVTVENRETTQVSGYDAVVYDLTYDGDGER